MTNTEVGVRTMDRDPDLCSLLADDRSIPVTVATHDLQRSVLRQFLSIAGMFMRIFNLVCIMLLIGHWNGCLQFFVPMLLEYPSNSWVAINELQVNIPSESFIINK